MTNETRKGITCGTIGSSGFDELRAQELICLGREARLLYRKGASLKKENRLGEKDLSEMLPVQIPLEDDLPEPFKGRQYTILAPLVFTQIVLRFIGQRLVFGFIAEPIDSERRNKELFIVYRGSQTPWDWISNFRIFQTKHSLFDANGVPGEVHRGFNAQYTRPDKMRKQPSIAQIIENTLTPNVVAGRTIYIAGHSLGGALATLTAAHVKQLHPETDVHLYSSASPRVGDGQFAKYFTTRQIKAFRIYNTADTVPTLPPRFESPFEMAQYVHVGVNIPFTSQTESREFNHTLPIYARAVGLDYEQFNYLPKGQSLPFKCEP